MMNGFVSLVGAGPGDPDLSGSAENLVVQARMNSATAKPF